MNQSRRGKQMGKLLGLVEIALDIPHWINVEERVPDISGIYIAYSRKLGVVACEFCVYHGEETWYQCGWGGWKLTDVTHWMPLPGPPKRK